MPLDIEAGPNDSLERVTTLLRDAVAQRSEVSVEPSSEAGKVAMFYWTGQPRFRGIITTMGVKYTMFLAEGIPVRATADIKTKEAGNVRLKTPRTKPDCP